MIQWNVIAIAIAMMSACATAQSDPMTKGAQLIAQFREASGGAMLDGLTTYHSSGKRVRDGSIDGVFEAWGDFRTMAHTTVETFAGVTSTGGHDGKVGWTLGPDGTARISDTPQAIAGLRLGAYLNTQGYPFPDRFPRGLNFLDDGKPTVLSSTS